MSERVEDGGAALLPCPFCGEDPRLTAETDVVDGFVHSYTMTCDTCGISMSDEYSDDLQEAWNRRSPSEPLNARTQGVEGGR